MDLMVDCIHVYTQATSDDDDATFTSCDNNGYVSAANKGLFISRPT